MRGSALAVLLAAAAGAAAGGSAEAQAPQAAQPAQAPLSPRVALVVGEGAYRSGPLPTAPNDAGLVAQVLAGAGFDVTGARDLDGDGLRRAFRDFLDRAAAAGPDGIAVVYFAGRAVQSDGDDFLVPVDARLARPADVPIEALRLADFTHALVALPIQARVVVVDGAYAGFAAPSPAAGGPNAPGLALAEAEQGELLAFNAAPGTLAPAAPGPYGVYAQALAAAMKQGGVPVGEVFDRVRLAVNGATGGAVVPWDSDKLTRGFAFFDRAPGAPAVASAQVPFAALERRPLSSFPPAEAYDVAVARDTLPAYSEFLTAFPDDPLARRVRLILAVRREALFWRAAVANNAPGGYWTYLARYPKGPHAGDARRQLTRLAAAFAPPPRFVPVAFDVPPPGPDEVVYDRAIAFDAPDLPPPPPPPVFLLPPPVVVAVERPPPPPGPQLLPVPVPVAVPYVRPPVEPGTLAPPRFVPGGYARPRPYARGPNGDGLVVQAAPPQPAPQQPAAQQPAPPPPAPPPPAAGARPRSPAAAAPGPVPSPVPVLRPAAPPVGAAPAPQPQPAPAARTPSLPASPAVPSHALPVPPPAAAPPIPPAMPTHGQPGAKPPAATAPAASPPVSPVPAPPAPAAPPRPTGAAPTGHRPPPAPPQPGAPADPRPHASPAPATPAAPPTATPVPPAPRPRPPAAQPQPVAPAPAPPKPAAQPAPRPEPEPPRPAAPPAPPPPARRAPDGAAPERPAAALPGRAGPEHPPGEHRLACGHPGEPPCRP